MEIEEYFADLTKNFNAANAVASAARSKGYDPETFVEIKAAPDLASRVEGILDVPGLAELIKSKGTSKSRQELAFDIVRELCTNKKFEMETEKRILLAVRVGLSIITEAVLVAPKEGVQGIEMHKNADGTDYAAILYAGPIRGAGGTSAALSVALADCARQTLGVGKYAATQTEAERIIEEMLIYNARCARLQYLPSEDDMRSIIMNLPVCVDGLPTEEIEIGVRRNVKRLDKNGNEQVITNRIRGALGLVICEGIAQKAKSVLKHTKNAGLDWSWLNSVIKVDKGPSPQKAEDKPKDDAVFLQEGVAGRPVLAYPNHPGSFRLRYGRSRLTGIAGKGFSPATMFLLDEFVAMGTQLKIEKPGKGCIAMPVDSIEGPFVKLKNGEAFRVNDIDTAKKISSQVSKILSVGDMLVTYGDFKKSNTPMAPTSYVEEYWYEQLKAAGFQGSMPNVSSFQEACALSAQFKVPMHPLFIYDYADVTVEELGMMIAALAKAEVKSKDGSLYGVESVSIAVPDDRMRWAVEKLCIPHFDSGDRILFRGSDAQSLLSSLGLAKEGKLPDPLAAPSIPEGAKSPLEAIGALAPFKVMRRATVIGGRIGRPEKARERLMTPTPHVLFPISSYGGRDRSIFKGYMEEKRKFGNQAIELETARYRCPKGKEMVPFPYCEEHSARAELEKVCVSCARVAHDEVCASCGGKTRGYHIVKVSLVSLVDQAMKNAGVQVLPKLFKGVKGMISRDKIAEPLEKGILRALHGISIYKDGTVRFDATDVPITHFYPGEFKVGLQRLRELGYTKDYLGKELTDESQLVEMMHQDVILNRRGAEYLLRVAQFIDDLLVKFYKAEPFYRISSVEGLVGQQIITLSPHTSCGVLGRVIGFTDANIGLAHPYVICARRRNCDGDEDTTMLLLDALINFSKRYLPSTVGGTMDAPLILTLNVVPEEVDDEVHAMEVCPSFGLEFYDKTMQDPHPAPGDMKVELVGNRLNKREVYSNVGFTHVSGPQAIAKAQVRSSYVTLKTMQEKIDLQFSLMDKLYSIEKADTAKRLIMSHFIPDLMGNLHSYSKQTFRCVNCNAKYRRTPLSGKCSRCGGKLVLTISKGGILKYLKVAQDLSERYNIEPYVRQRIMLLKDEIESVFGGLGDTKPTGQFDLANYM